MKKIARVPTKISNGLFFCLSSISTRTPLADNEKSVITIMHPIMAYVYYQRQRRFQRANAPIPTTSSLGHLDIV
jgi:hypothetical protein